MGQKVNPTGLRIGLVQGWNQYLYMLNIRLAIEVDKIETYIQTELARKGYIVGRVIATYAVEKIELDIEVGIMNSEQNMKEDWIKVMVGLRKLLQQTKIISPKQKIVGRIECKEFKDFDVRLLSEWAKTELEKGTKTKNIIYLVREWYEETKEDKDGLKIKIKGRINGVEMATDEWASVGYMSLQKIKNKIDYLERRSYTQHGVTSIRIWINKKAQKGK